jgi:hypothetical protein
MLVKLFSCLMFLALSAGGCFAQNNPNMQFWRFQDNGQADPPEYNWKGEVTRQAGTSVSLIEATRNLVCKVNQFDGIRPCVGAVYLGTLEIGSQLTRAKAILLSTKVRYQADRIEILSKNFSSLLDRRYAPRYGSMREVMTRAGGPAACSDFYDADNRTHASAAIACRRPMPERFHFSSWLRSTIPHLNSSEQLLRLTQDLERQKPTLCQNLLLRYHHGNRLAMLSELSLVPIPSSQDNNFSAIEAIMVRFQQRNPSLRDEMNLVFNAVAGDCDELYRVQ